MFDVYVDGIDLILVYFRTSSIFCVETFFVSETKVQAPSNMPGCEFDARPVFSLFLVSEILKIEVQFSCQSCHNTNFSINSGLCGLYDKQKVVTTCSAPNNRQDSDQPVKRVKQLAF